jgi:hypothetical protein
MTPETKSEIIVVGIAAAILLLLWGRNRAAGGGTGLEMIFPNQNQQTPLAGGATLFDVPAPVPGYAGSLNAPGYLGSLVGGDTFGYTANPYALPSPNQFTLGAGEASACNCQANGQGGSTFGSTADLSAWLSAQPGVMANATNALTNWN